MQAVFTPSSDALAVVLTIPCGWCQQYSPILGELCRWQQQTAPTNHFYEILRYCALYQNNVNVGQSKQGLV